MKSPATRVSLQVGTAEEAFTETAGASSPPTGGTVIMNTLLLARASARDPSGEISTSSGGGVLPGAPPGAGGPVTRTTVLMSVPSYRIESRPSDPAQT